MKKVSVIIISLALVGMYAACQKSNKAPQSKFVVASTTGGQPVMASVYFGNPPAGGGPCIGKGICDAIAYTPGAGTTVCFQVSANSSNVLLMGFHLSDLENNQPSQASYFQSGSYAFDGTYPLTTSLYSPLDLYPNAAIDSGVSNPVIINGDSVTVAITYAHN